MIYTYLCWTHDVWVRWKFSNFIFKSAQHWQIQTPHSYHLKMQSDENQKFTGCALTLEMLTLHSRCTCSHVQDFRAMDGAIPKPSACRLMGPQKSLCCRHLAKYSDAKDGKCGNGFRCSQGAQIGIQNADGEIRAHGLRRTHRHGFCNNVLQHFKFHKPSVVVCWCDERICAGEAWILSLPVPYRYRLAVFSWAAPHQSKRPYLIAMWQCVPSTARSSSQGRCLPVPGCL